MRCIESPPCSRKFRHHSSFFSETTLGRWLDTLESYDRSRPESVRDTLKCLANRRRVAHDPRRIAINLFEEDRTVSIAIAVLPTARSA